MTGKYHLNYYFHEPMAVGDIQLVQLGRLYCLPDTRIEKHAHGDWFELTCVTDGQGSVVTNGVATAVKKGDIYLSFPGDFHEITSEKDFPLKYDFFAFQTTHEELKNGLKELMASLPSYDRRLFVHEGISFAVSQAIGEMTREKEYKTEVLHALFTQILYLLLRSFRQTESAGTTYISSKDELCFQLMQYMDTHIYSMKNLQDLAEHFRFNYAYLSTVFRETTGNTLSAYYRSRRMDCAELMLRERKMKINEIADLLGYASSYAFSKAFKSNFGISPRGFLSSL